MANLLRISLFQTYIDWEDKASNMRHVYKMLKRVAGKTDLAILPETFSTGFTMNVKPLAETNNGETMTNLRQWAKSFDLAITGSFIARADLHYYNRGFFLAPDGSNYYYDKRHLFSMGGENKRFAPGKKRLIVPYKGWNICLQICYDLRFPVWSRNTGKDYDLLIYVANWPEARRSAWQKLLPARAIENQAYVCGVNCVGTSPDKTTYCGGTRLYSPKGDILKDAWGDCNSTRTVTIDKDELNAFRTKFPAWRDADKFHFDAK
ncbi:MAG: nitrilase family protein [Tannerellaceae bacterium]|jgi:predicted amidohydrolase|nr:nitrilase family protein [Tannerellaceae bacterium]